MTDDRATASPAPVPAVRQPFLHRDRLEYWAFWSQIISALAVVVSLVFVGIQLRSSNSLAIRAEENSTQSQWFSFRSSVYANRETAVMFVAGLNGKQLDATDQMRFHYVMREHGWATFQLWDRANQGLIPHTSFNTGAAGDYLRLICTPGGAKAWATIKREFPPPYVSELDRLAVPYAKVNQVRCTP